jgi:hypothetical protein
MADYYSNRSLPCTYNAIRRHFLAMTAALRDSGATYFRYTIVCPEMPLPPYPDGLYVEGWKVAPSSADFPEFEFPLTDNRND